MRNFGDFLYFCPKYSFNGLIVFWCVERVFLIIKK